MLKKPLLSLLLLFIMSDVYVQSTGKVGTEFDTIFGGYNRILNYDSVNEIEFQFIKLMGIAIKKMRKTLID